MKKVFLFVLTFLLFIPWSVGQNVVAYYPFNGNGNDQSGNNRNPSHNGAMLTTDRFGNANSAYFFTGATYGHIEYSSTGLPETNRTISLWFQSADLSSKPTLLSYGGNGCATALLMAINSSTTGHYPSPQYLVTGHCNTNNITYAYPTEPLNDWYHWVLTINGSEQKIYINGELKSTQNTYSGSTYTTNRELAFGVATYIDGLAPYTDGNLGYFNGKLDDIRIYDAALSITQVQQLYQAESTGLVAYYPFNGNANDESGNGYHGTVSGATLTTDRFDVSNKAYNFVWNGTSSDKIQIPGTSTLHFNTGGFAISAWFKFSGTSNNGYNYPIVSKHVCSENSGYILMLYNNKLTFWTGGAGWSGYLSTTENYTDGNWYHVVATYDGTNRKIYVNGSLKASDVVAYTAINTANIALGGYNGCNGGFNGKVDEIRIYNNPLSSTEVQQLYQSESTGLVAFYPFNGNANDESIFQNHGTVQHAVLTTDRFGNSDKAYSFSNPNHITVPYNPYVFTDAFTLSYWFKIPSYYGDRGVLSCVATPNGGFQQWFTGQTFQYILGYNFPNWFWANHTLQSPVNQWHQMVMTYQKTGTSTSETKLYINGELKTTNQHDLAISYTPGATFYIGQNHGGLNFQGDLDDLKVYNHVLTAGEILENYEHEATCSGPLTAAITSANNTGAGSLRAAVGCLEGGGMISWSPTLDRVLLSASLAIDKNITISGSDLQVNPVIIFDMMNMTSGFMFSDGVELNIDDVDIKIRNHSANKAITQGDGTLTVSGMTTVFRDLYPVGTTHCDPIYTTDVVDVTNPITGRTWMDRNLGAGRVATSSTDSEAYGDLYQWGRFGDGHQCRNSGITDVLSNSDNPGHAMYIINNNPPYDWRSPQNNSLWQIPVNTNNPCPIGYRVPSVQEFNEEVATWSGSGADPAFNSVLKLPLAGGRNTANGNLHDTNNVGYYWTKDPETNESQLFFFYQNTMQISPFNRGFGAAVRCIKE